MFYVVVAEKGVQNSQYNFMLKRSRRLTRCDVEHLLSVGKRTTSSHFVMVYTDNIHGGTVVVGKKVAKTSVQRHKIKRQLRSVCRDVVPIERGHILFARKGAETLTYNELELEVRNLLSR